MERGAEIGRYRAVELLGRGGMGEVWQALDTVTERTVAIKVLPPHLAGDDMFRRRFHREAKAAANLTDPHVVPIYDFGEIDGHLFVSMQLVDGHDLQAVLAEGALEPHRAVAIISQVASALHAAHRAGLVHRDVKPSNILIAADDFTYLIDFGIARAAGETGLTSTGTTIGTWEYMAPERFQNGTADARADTYALTCVLHQALTGEVPYPANSIEQIAVAHMLKPPPRPSELNPHVSAAMDQVIATGMAKDPDQRYSSIKALGDAARAALEPAIKGAGDEARSTSPSPAPRDELLNNSDDTVIGPDLSADPRTEAGATVSAAAAPTRRAPIAPAGQSEPNKAAGKGHPPTHRPPPGGTRFSRKMALAGVTVAVIATFLVLVAVTRGSQSGERGTPPFQTAPTSSATDIATSITTPSGPPVSEGELKGLLLVSDGVNAAMQARQMAVTRSRVAMSDDSATMQPTECLAIDGAAQSLVYADSGFVAVRDQTLQEGDNFAHFAEQAVVLFPSADQASAFVAAAAQQWPNCHRYTHTQSGSEWEAGTASETDGVLSVGTHQLNTQDWSCERALTVRNNVVIDVDTCSASAAGSAVNIANQIAAKVPA